jgi:hypothetical protein
MKLTDRLATTLAAKTDEGSALIELLAMDDDRPITVEALLVQLADAVSRDEEGRELTGRDVFKAAKRRYFRLGTVATPFGPIGWHMVNLYCEAATFCDVAELRDEPLGDEGIAAHLLVLWNVMPDLPSAQAAFAGTGPSVLESVRARAVDGVRGQLPGVMTKRAAILTLWRLRGAMGAVRGVRVVAGPSLRGRLFPGKRVKELIAEAEAQLDAASA